MRMTLLFVLLAGMAFSCSSEETTDAEEGSVTLHFSGVFDKAPLMMFEQAYPYQAGMHVKFQLFNFYISDVTLIREDDGDGEEVKVLDVALVNFADVLNQEAAERGIDIPLENVPPGVYRGIRFGLGLTPELNRTQPGDYPPGHPLTDNYWSWAMGYVFFKVEGNADLNGDGAFTEKLTFHIGGDDYFQSVEFPTIFELGSGETYEIDLAVDLEKVLHNGHEYVDFHQVTQDHTNDPELASFMAGNLAGSMQMKN